MIVTTVIPEDFSYTPPIGPMQGYYTYTKLSENNYTISIRYDADVLGTTRPNIGKILPNKKVDVIIDIFDNAEKTPICCNIVGGSIDGLGKTITPILRESTSFTIRGNYAPSLIVTRLSDSGEYILDNIAKINAANHCLTMFTNWNGESNVDNGEYLSVLCIDNKDLVNTSGVWVFIEWTQMEDYIKANSNGDLIFHYHNQSMSDVEIVNNILKEVMEDIYVGNFTYLLKYEDDANLVDYNNSFQIFIDNSKSGYGDKTFYIEIWEDENNKSVEELNINTIDDGVFEAPENVLYNKVNLTIPKKEYVLDLAKPTSGTDRTNIIGKDGTITPITPNGYLISRISGKVAVKDVNLAITANGTKTYESEGSFYNKIDINTNVQSIGDIKVGLSISEVNCNKDTLFYDESNIVFKLNVVVNDNYSVYLSTDGGRTFTEYTGDFVELNFVLGDVTKKIYYKLKNKNDNTYTSTSSIEIPVLGYILNAIEVPEIKVVKTGNDKVTIYVTSIDSIDQHFNCNLNINNKDYTIDDIDNNYVDVKIASEYLTIESYFYKNINGNVYRGNSSNLVVNTNSLAVIELTKIEYNDPAYVYSKVPTKYYGVYLTLLKLLSDNGETLLNDCASACKSSSHKLTSLWNMFNAACGAYLNDNKKLADVLIKTITSQLNIMYDENFDFLQHRIFIGNYTLGNKNNPNEFNTVDLYKLTPTEYDVCSDVELTFTIKQTSDIHYIMLPPELDLKYVSFGDTIKTVLFDSENNINLYKTRSWRMADKDTDGTIYWYYSPAGAFDDIITVVCKHK